MDGAPFVPVYITLLLQALILINPHQFPFMWLDVLLAFGVYKEELGSHGSLWQCVYLVGE